MENKQSDKDQFSVSLDFSDFRELVDWTEPDSKLQTSDQS